ncbi:hypothetical protein, partial [Streptomyces xantholiticus]|uniref:hypothetical protein n=1 Tax=Streptomyces xantholiticus TaxID=68285 RepID=UPI001E58B1C0
MMEVTGVHKDESAALSRLSKALGVPSHRAAENAKALFPFIAFEAAMAGAPVDHVGPVAAHGDRTHDSAGRPQAGSALLGEGPHAHLPDGVEDR